jgi:hypothetical protein
MATRRTELSFADLDQVIAEVRRLQEGGYRRAGNWSLGQCCRHLAYLNTASLDGFGPEVGIPKFVQRILPIVGKPILWLVFKKGMPSGLKAPKALQPPPDVDESAEVTAMIRSLERVRDAGPSDFKPSPIFGRLSREQWQQLHRIHAAHHLGHLVPNGAATAGEPATA